jgi:acyl-CoA synthetase (AMP-forming)/AMP-acid ligase II
MDICEIDTTSNPPTLRIPEHFNAAHDLLGCNLRAGRGSDALANELKAFVKSRLAPYEYPRWIEFVADLPKTVTGKIQRFKLRAACNPTS